MITNKLTITPEYWFNQFSVDNRQKYTYISPEGYLYNVDKVENNQVHLWGIDAWGRFYHKSVNIYEFRQTWREYKANL